MRTQQYRMLTLADGGSLFALKKKGNLTHVETLYNPNNFFSEVHILVFDKKDLSVELANSTLKVHYIKHFSFGKWGMALSLPWMIWQIIRIIHKHKIQVIRARNAYLAGFLGVLCGKLTGKPSIVSLGGDNRLAQALLGHYYLGSRFLSFTIEQFSLRNAQRIFSVNEFTKQYVKRLGALSENIRIIPHCIDIDPVSYELDGIKARAELGFGQDPVVLIVGRLEADKQVDRVIEAIPSVFNYYPDVKFIFLGDGSLRTPLENRVKELQIEKAVKFIGFAPRKQVVRYLAASNIVCIPMSGFVIYEAAAAKKPIVAFDVEWHSEFIQDGITGKLVKNRDSLQLANAIITLLSDTKMAISLGINANQKFKNEFDRNRIIASEVEAYKELLA